MIKSHLRSVDIYVNVSVSILWWPFRVCVRECVRVVHVLNIMETVLVSHSV